MGETAEYHIVMAMRGREHRMRLISSSAMEDSPEYKEMGLIAFFEPGSTNIKDLGTIQCMGDTHLLVDTYIEE